MTREGLPSSASRPPLLRRLAPVAALLVLAPWVGEFLLGNVPASQIPALPFLIPLYGAGAVLVREAARHAGRGWPSILLLAAAYGVIEAGLVDQSMFNPTFEGHAFQAVTPIPALGISAYYTLSFVAGHMVWSISIPIAIVEMLTPSERRTAPWLGRIGLALMAALYLLGCYIIFADLLRREGFLATPAQMAGAAVAALLLIAAAFAIGRRRSADGDRAVPTPWALGSGALLVSGLFVARPESWLGVAMGLAILCLAGWLAHRWSRQRAWTLRHQFALVAGTLLTYAWLGFVLTLLIRPDDTTAWIGNVVFALLAVALLWWTGKAVADRPGKAA